MYHAPLDKLLQSSVWAQPYATRIVWVMLLGQMDDSGFVPMKTIAMVADSAHVSRADAQAAVAWLQSPDPDNRTQTHEGRRIEPCTGGWRVLNAQAWRQTAEDLRDAFMRGEGMGHV